ncbi:hypothetical protein G6F22_020579 [Rhizopus arrhizus]|nr:hypothetical protein G6F22_020579 [Rhizopus arrhizus]
MRKRPRPSRRRAGRPPARVPRAPKAGRCGAPDRSRWRPGWRGPGCPWAGATGGLRPGRVPPATAADGPSPRPPGSARAWCPGR